LFYVFKKKEALKMNQNFQTTSTRKKGIPLTAVYYLFQLFLLITHPRPLPRGERGLFFPFSSFASSGLKGRLKEKFGYFGVFLSGLIAYSIAYSAENHAPVVKNVHAQQRQGALLVDITYDVEDADGDSLEIIIEASNDNGKTYTIIPKSLTGDVGKNITPGRGKKVVWDVGKDLPNTKGENFKARVIADDSKPPEGMVLIPAGEFSMGDHFNEGDSDEKPVHTVYLDAFYIDVCEVTNAQYAKFLNEYGKNIDAVGHELLDIDDTGCLIEKVGNTYKPKAGYENHPVIYVSWYGAAAYAQFYGKRLPTEAEWEKAARGGLVGKRYPWGDDITHDNANYSGTGGNDKWDRTSPVGSFAPYGYYGLYDMAGNVWEWCADEFDSGYYSKSPKNNPKGPGIAITFKNNDFTNVSTGRVLRGGPWHDNPYNLRCANRNYDVPTGTVIGIGFRCSQDR
jgi:formylglycine-generating enzyme required for sulfatase activity